jgi:uncharacterized protein
MGRTHLDRDDRSSAASGCAGVSTPGERLRLDEGAEGTRIRVRAVPGARREGVLGAHGDALRVAVRAVAEKGRANAALVEVLARALGLRPGDVEIVSGAGSRDKTVLVRGLGAAAVRQRLRLGGDPNAAAGYGQRR